MLLSFGKICTWSQILGLQVTSDQCFVSLSPCACVCSLCKLPLLGGDSVSHLPYTYSNCIVKRCIHTMCPALCGGIWGLSQAFSLAARKSGGVIAINQELGYD